MAGRGVVRTYETASRTADGGKAGEKIGDWRIADRRKRMGRKLVGEQQIAGELMG
jgi:hypothetical protein